MKFLDEPRNTRNTQNMICPKCHKDVEMLKFTTLGTMCRDCDRDSAVDQTAAFCSSPNIPPALDKIMAGLAMTVVADPKSSPREAFDSCKPYSHECIVTPENGGRVQLMVGTSQLFGQPAPRMVARYIRRMSPSEVQNLTPEKVEKLKQRARLTPAVGFYLQ